MLTTEDRIEINDLYSRYAYAFDGDDPAAWADLFTPDGVFQQEGSDPISGNAALQEFARAKNEAAPGITHHTVNVIAEQDADGQTIGRAYVLAFRITDAKVRIRNAGAYRDVLAQVDGRWRFRARHFGPWLDPELVDSAIVFE